MPGLGFLLTTGLPAATLIDAFMISNMMGKVIVLIQIASSIIAAAIIIGKNKELASIAASNKRFIREFVTGGDVLGLYLARKKIPTMSLALIYEKTCERLVKFLDPEMRRAVIGRQQGGLEHAALSANEIELVRSTCEHVLMEEEIRVEQGMGLLATIVTASPMLGLLGTVWGMLDAFASMGTHNAILLSAIAPSISAALLTTVTALLVAIPSAIFYNNLAGKIRQINNDMEGFADEVMGRVTCEFKGGN